MESKTKMRRRSNAEGFAFVEENGSLILCFLLAGRGGACESPFQDPIEPPPSRPHRDPSRRSSRQRVTKSSSQAPMELDLVFPRGGGLSIVQGLVRKLLGVSSFEGGWSFSRV